MHYKQLMTLVETARVEYETKLSAVDTSSHPDDGLLLDSKNLPEHGQVKTDLPSGSSCESSDSEVEGHRAGDILSTPWSIFFEHANSVSDQVERPSQSAAALNVNASEFIPTVTKEFVPLV